MLKFILILSNLLFLKAAWGAPFDDFKFHTGQRWDFSTEANFYKSDGNFDKSGNTFTRHASGYSYQNFALDLNLRTGLGPKWNIFGNTRLASAQSKSLSTGTPSSKSNTGLTHLQIGSDNQLYAGSMLVFSEVSFLFPLTSTERSAGGNVAISEGVTELEGKIILRVERRNFRFGGFGGLNFRDKGRSALVPYGIMGEFNLGSSSAIGTDLRGYQALTLDKETDNEFAIEQAYFCPVNGCAKKYAAFNPSIMQNNFWFRTNFSRSLGMHAGLSHDILGSNVSKGLNFYVGLIYRMKSRKTSDPGDFQEVIDDGIDQRAFERSNVTQPKPARPAKPKANLKDELNKTEQLIESNSDPFDPPAESEE